MAVLPCFACWSTWCTVLSTNTLARVFRFLRQGCFPSRWAFLRQGHIPKDGACEGDIKVSALRPISVASVWWRLWASARVRSEEVRAWTELVLPNYVVGGKKGHDVLSDVLEMEHEASSGSFLGTLDLSKAFDHLRPARAVAVLQHAGFSPKGWRLYGVNSRGLSRGKGSAVTGPNGRVRPCLKGTPFPSLL